MKRLKILALCSFLTLTACGSQTFYGKYTFAMGKEKEAHLNVSFDLQNKKYSYTDPETKQEVIKPNSFVFKIDVGTVEVEDDIGKILKKGISGFAEIQSTVYTYGNRLALGTVVTKELIPSLPDDFVLDPKLVEYCLMAYCNKSSLTLQIPVSLDDVKHQLCWYGYYVNILNDNIVTKLDMSKMPGVKGEGRFGTHPEKVYDDDGKVKENQVDMVNETFAREFSNTKVFSDDTCLNYVGSISQYIDVTGTHYVFYKNDGGNATQLDNVYIRGSGDAINVNISLYDGNADSSLITKIVDVKSGQEIPKKNYVDFYAESFVFRDFHDLRISLLK